MSKNKDSEFSFLYKWILEAIRGALIILLLLMKINIATPRKAWLQEENIQFLKGFKNRNEKLSS